MRLHLPFRLARVWLVAGVVFIASVAISRVISPPVAQTPADGASVPASYYVGLIGLIAICVALVATWRWAGVGGRLTNTLRVSVRAAVVFGFVLWALAMLFPFL